MDTIRNSIAWHLTNNTFTTIAIFGIGLFMVVSFIVILVLMIGIFIQTRKK